MFTQNDVQILEKLLPSKGVKLIREKTTISKPTIKKFFKGEKIRTDLAQIIYEAALSLIEENNCKENKKKKKTAKLLKGQSAEE